MASPGIELTWGFEWKKTQRRYAEPYVTCAADLAVEGLGALGIELTSDREIRARRVARTAEIDGEQCGPLVEISLCSQDIKRKRLPRSLIKLTRTAVHELTHTEHEARIGPSLRSVVGDCVSEGIAYSAETDFAGLLRGERPGGDYIDYALSGVIPDKTMSELLEDSNQCYLDSPEGQSIHYKWFEDCNNAWGGPLGVVIGIRSVHKARQQGMTYDDLLSINPAEVLKLAA